MCIHIYIYIYTYDMYIQIFWFHKIHSTKNTGDTTIVRCVLASFDKCITSLGLHSTVILLCKGKVNCCQTPNLLGIEWLRQSSKKRRLAVPHSSKEGHLPFIHLLCQDLGLSVRAVHKEKHQIHFRNDFVSISEISEISQAHEVDASLDCSYWNELLYCLFLLHKLRVQSSQGSLDL